MTVERDDRTLNAAESINCSRVPAAFIGGISPGLVLDPSA
jgi:hypothetical protein